MKLTKRILSLIMATALAVSAAGASLPQTLVYAENTQTVARPKNKGNIKDKKSVAATISPVVYGEVSVANEDGTSSTETRKLGPYLYYKFTTSDVTAYTFTCTANYDVNIFIATHTPEYTYNTGEDFGAYGSSRTDSGEFTLMANTVYYIGIINTDQTNASTYTFTISSVSAAVTSDGSNNNQTQSDNNQSNTASNQNTQSSTTQNNAASSTSDVDTYLNDPTGLTVTHRSGGSTQVVVEDFDKGVEVEFYDAEDNLIDTKRSSSGKVSTSKTRDRGEYYCRARSFKVIKKEECSSDWTEPVYFISAPKSTTSSKDKTKSSVKLSWEPVSGAKSYVIYVSSSRDGKYKKVKTIKGKKTSVNIKKIGKKKLDLTKGPRYFAIQTIGDKKEKSSDMTYIYVSRTYR